MSEHPPSADRPSGPAGSGHPEIDELASYVAGDSGVAGLAALRAHLADCADCIADVAALRRADDEVQQLVLPVMPADVAARLDRAIEAARSGASAASNVLPLQRKRSSAGWATGAAAAAVVGLLGAITIGALNGSRSDDKDAPAAASAKATVASASGAVYATGTDYTPERLGAQVKNLLLVPAPPQDASREAAGAPAAAAGE
ncbi:MAG: hypothetical protein ABIM89_00065, partial [Mycobacteriales bacterium]